MKPKRIVIIGLDGVPFGMLKNFADTGVMPNTNQIIRQGFFRPIRSSVPEISSVAWSSIITAANPAEHAIFGFVDLQPYSYKMRFPNFNDLKKPAFWNRCAGKSAIINVPSTYPVRDMNGVHISGFVSIDFEKSVHPKSLAPELKSLGYRLDVDAQKAHSDIDAFLEDVDATLTARIKAVEYLWGYDDWNVFMPTFTGTDRLMHFLFDAYEDKSHRYHNDFVGHFRKIDAAVGGIYSRLTKDDVLIMLSDHGFERLEKDVYVNNLLAAEGFLKFNPSFEAKLENIDSATKAFALEPARIYINRKGRYPAGRIDAADAQSCLKDLHDLFASLQVDGRKVISHIYRKEEIYSGPYLDDAADLILIADKGFNLKGSMAAKELFAKGPFTGKHTYEDAFLLTKDKEPPFDFGAQPSVIDAGKLINTLLNNG